MRPAVQYTGAVLGGANRGQCPRNSEPWTPLWPPARQGVCINNTMTDFLQWFCSEGEERNKVSVNTVLSEWGIYLFFRLVCAPQQKSWSQPPIKTGLEPALPIYLIFLCHKPPLLSRTVRKTHQWATSCITLHDRFLHYHEHGQCSLFWVKHIHLLLLCILARAPNVYKSTPENSPLQMCYLLLSE